MMKRYLPPVLAVSCLVLSSCTQNSRQQPEEVVGQRYLHKYGYDVSPAEWEQASYPGRVVTTLRNGVIVSSSYENHELHGETTQTYPHSQTIATRSVYERGNLQKRTFYSLSGLPEKEEVFLSPSHVKTTRWYQNTAPMSIEEWVGDALEKGTYYTPQNTISDRVENRCGTRIVRDPQERIAFRETISDGFPTLKETFYPHGSLHVWTPLSNGVIEGQKKVYAQTGELLSIETYRAGLLDGKTWYYQNGNCYLEMDYQDNLKHGLERHFVDGTTLVEETSWYEGKKHGPSTLYFDEMSTVRWFYNDELVSKEKYEKLSEQEDAIAIMQQRSFLQEDLKPLSSLR